MARRAPPRQRKRSARAPGPGVARAKGFLRRVQALAEPYAPGRARIRPVEGGWLRLEIRGRGKRRLRGGRPDDRGHVVTVDHDGAFLQMSYRVAGDLRDSRFLSFPTTRDLRGIEDFLEKALGRMRP